MTYANVHWIRKSSLYALMASGFLYRKNCGKYYLINRIAELDRCVRSESVWIVIK